MEEKCLVGVRGLNGPTGWSSGRDQNLQEVVFLSVFMCVNVNTAFGHRVRLPVQVPHETACELLESFQAESSSPHFLMCVFEGELPLSFFAFFPLCEFLQWFL